MDILAGMSGLKTGIDLLRSLRDALKSGQMKPDEVAGRIGEIYDYIVDSKDALVDAKDRIQELQAQLKSLNDESVFRSSLIFDSAGLYSRRVGNIEEVYCSACLDTDNKRLRVTGGGPDTGAPFRHIHGYRE
jgi:hypothetical protein